MGLGPYICMVLEENGTEVIKGRFSKDGRPAAAFKGVKETCPVRQLHGYYGFSRQLGCKGVENSPLADIRLWIGML